MTIRLVVFIRHGEYDQLPETPSAHQLPPLTDKGRAQAETGAAEILGLLQALGADIHPVIHTSSLPRAWQTAKVMHQTFAASLAGDLTLQQTDLLAERSLGGANNLSLNHITDLINQDERVPCLPVNWKSDSHFRLPVIGAESLIQAGERVNKYVEAVLYEAHQSPSIRKTAHLFVGHGAAFRHAAYLMGALPFDEIARLSMFHARPVVFERNADRSWSHIAGRWKQRTKILQDID